MNDYVTVDETTIAHTSLGDLEKLERSLNTLIEKHKYLKAERDELANNYSNLNQNYQHLLVKHQKIEQRIQSLLERLVELEI